MGSIEGQLRKIVASLDPAQPVFEIRTMQQRVEETWATPRLLTYLLTIFAGLASTLAVVGIYGVMAYNGQRRSREIGVRLALGARYQQITAMMLGEGMRLLGLGVASGLVAAILLVRLIRGLLFGVTPTDPVVYLAVTLLLSVAAMLASWLPLRRATRVDPMIVLRSE
jgi:putative ABC transport system permease protein